MANQIQGYHFQVLATRANTYENCDFGVFLEADALPLVGAGSQKLSAVYKPGQEALRTEPKTQQVPGNILFVYSPSGLPTVFPASDLYRSEIPGPLAGEHKVRQVFVAFDPSQNQVLTVYVTAALVGGNYVVTVRDKP